VAAGDRRVSQRKMKKYIIILISLLLWVSGYDVMAADYFTREELVPCIVHLKQERIKKIELKGEQVEFWYKRHAKNKPEPLYEYPSGSGFLGESGGQLFLITAGHVAKDMTSTAWVILKGDDGKPRRFNLSDLGDFQNSVPWFYHPEADVAILHLNPSHEFINRHLTGHFLPLSLIPQTLNAPSRDTPLTVSGFPLGLGSDKDFSPLTKQSYSASDLLTLKRADNNKFSTFFVLEDPSIGGYSGGPVFDISIYKLGATTTKGDGTKLLGIIHGTVSDETGGKLAAVTPSFYILETIRLFLRKTN